jgi:hypothetical protein
MGFINRTPTERGAYSYEQALRAVPEAALAYAELRARQEGRDLSLADLPTFIREPDGEVNYAALKQLLAELSSDARYPAVYQVAIRAELINLMRQAEEALGVDDRTSDLMVDADLMGKMLFNAMREQAAEQEGLKAAYEEIRALLEPSVQKTELASNYLPGADFRRLPNFRKLGITERAGPISEEELTTYFKGQTRPDGTPVTVDDFYGVPIVLANNDLIEDRSLRIPALELMRLAAMMELRLKSSDFNHDFEVEDSTFTVIKPRLGFDPSIPLNHRLGDSVQEPYTALVAKAVFPITTGGQQLEMVERVRRQLLRFVSITPLLDSYTCSKCAERQIVKSQYMDGKLVAIQLEPCPDKTMTDVHEYYKVVIRMPDRAVVGGFSYYELQVLNSEGDVMALQPSPLQLTDGAVVMTRMEILPIMFGAGFSPRYCAMHGLQGWVGDDGCPVAANVTNIRGLLNVALASSGAIKDAMLVLDPDTTV